MPTPAARRVVSLVAACLSLVSLATPAPAQPGFTPGPLDAAINEAARQNKFLIVVTSTNNTTAKVAEQVWSAPATVNWVKRHALGVNIRDVETFRKLNEAGLLPPVGVGFKGDPLLYRSGRAQRLFGSNGQQSRLSASPQGPSPASIAMALRLEWTLRGMAASDNWWLQAHERSLAPAEPVKLRLFHSRDDAGGPAIADPPPASGASRPDVLAVWDRARDAYAAGDLRTATGLYTWLWERGGELEPALEPAILYLAGSEMAVIAGKRAESKSRFAAMRDAAVAALDVADPAAVYRYIVLCRVIGDHVENLDFIDSALNDTDAALVMPASDRQFWELALPRLHFNDPAATTRTPQNWLARIQQRLTGIKPKRIDDAQWARFGELARWLALRDGARIYAALLAAGRDEDAATAAATTMSLVPGPQTGRALAATALAARRPRESQRAWLSGAADPLMASLDRQLAEKR